MLIIASDYIRKQDIEWYKQYDPNHSHISSSDPEEQRPTLLAQVNKGWCKDRLWAIDVRSNIEWGRQVQEIQEPKLNGAKKGEENVGKG